jgi:two-component system NtrC family sensor kinase
MKKLALTLVIILSITVSEAQQSDQFYIDSLKHELTIAKEDTNKAHILISLADLYFKSHPDTIIYAQQASDLSKKLNFDEGILEAELALSSSAIVLGNYPLALDHGFKALSLAKKINPSALGGAYALLTYSYYYLGEYTTALKYIQEGIKSSPPGDAAYGWRDFALVYHSLNQPDSAMLYAKKAYENLQSFISEGNSAGNASGILADAYAGKASYDSALFFYRKGVTLLRDNIILLYLIDNYNGIAGVYKATHNLDSAAWYCKKVLSEKVEKKYPIGLLRAANMLADIYETQKKPDSALKYLRTALNIKDSLFSREKTMAIQNLAFKEQEKQNEIEAAKLQSENRLKMYSLLGGLFTLLAIAGLLLRSNRQKQKANTTIEKAYGELQSTQKQLIQSEKMASLGELTAGIAHEIQNPLNFVNNFSEVNKELLAEMKDEIEKGNIDEVKALANDVIDNEEKINHHGKRADAIVKGMLQHSRTTTGTKEPTDINALCDEYLRLSYHGLRAKDKTFNADFKTDFDESIGLINIIPQDIGRVFLNLYNNAFYAVNEKRQKNIEGYEPTVSVSTKNTGDNVAIKVADNGNGIPQKIVYKIFQPFFTTKPTGQGTGLGLSLSYDIIKAHGGEINVEKTEDVKDPDPFGKGTIFTIQLPTA